MQSLDAFLSRLLPQAPGVPDPLAKQALIDSAIEFCEETLLVQVTSDPQAVTAGVGLYSLSLPSQQSAAVTMKAWYGTQPLQPAAAHQIDAILAYVSEAGTETAPTGTPTAFYEVAPGEIGLYPVPDQTADLMFSARVATKPLRSAASLDDVLYEDWIESVVAGALSRLHIMPEQSFSAPDLSAVERARFRYGVNRAVNVRVRGRLSTSISMSGRKFA